MLNNKNVNETRYAMNNDLENLVDKMSRWKTYAQEMRDLSDVRPKEEEEEEDWRRDRFLKFEGSGLKPNMFAHLRPKGVKK